MLAHGRSYSADFFLLVTPDRLYVWKDVGIEPVQTPPTYEADTLSGFGPYLESSGLDARHLSNGAFELLVSAWLGDVIRPEETAGEHRDHDWLVKSGFRRALEGGRIEFSALV